MEPSRAFLPSRFLPRPCSNIFAGRRSLAGTEGNYTGNAYIRISDEAVCQCEQRKFGVNEIFSLNSALTTRETKAFPGTQSGKFWYMETLHTHSKCGFVRIQTLAVKITNVKYANSKSVFLQSSPKDNKTGNAILRRVRATIVAVQKQ